MARAEVDKNTRAYQEQMVKGARATLLAVMLFTVVNLVLLVAEQGSYFLFSASVPYYLTMLGILMDRALGGRTFLFTALAVSAVCLVAYLLCWLLSKKRGGWLTVALALFVVDTVLLVVCAFTLLENPASCVMDAVFHGLAIYELAVGVRGVKKLKQLPPDPVRQMDGTPYFPEQVQ